MLPDWITQDAVAVVVTGVGVGIWKLWRFIKGQATVTSDSLTALMDAVELQGKVQGQHGEAIQAWGQVLAKFKLETEQRLQVQDDQIIAIRAGLESVQRVHHKNGGAQ